MDIEGLKVWSLSFCRGVEGEDLRRSERRLKRYVKESMYIVIESPNMAEEFPSRAKIVWRTENVKNVRKERRSNEVFEIKADMERTG